MMHTEQAIKKAESGGFKPDVMNWQTTPNKRFWVAIFLSDSSFWQSLGKAMGWRMSYEYGAHIYDHRPEWLSYWHRFIDHLADGKTMETFFKKLLSR